jgi:hypothetical protein
MDAVLSAKLSRLQNRHTRYEIAATHPDGRKLLIAYSARKNRQGLIAAVHAYGVAIVRNLKLPEDVRMYPGKRACDPITIGEWSFAFSGRTQRDCILSGELPSMGA